MKRTGIVVLALLVVITLMAAGRVPEKPIVAFGVLHWTPASVCEHPINGGYLQYYLTDGCGRELFLSGDLQQIMVGHSVWAEGTLLHNNVCQIVDVKELDVCEKTSTCGAAEDAAP
jgi:hypothetical protein